MDTSVRLSTIIIRSMEESIKFFSEVMGFEIDSEYDLRARVRITLMRSSGDGDAMASC